MKLSEDAPFTLPGAVSWAFDCMEIVEDLIGGTDAPFMAFKPSSILDDVRSLVLFEAHARELFARWEAGGDLRPGTMAEAAAALHLASLAAPLERNHAAAYCAAFRAVLPEKAALLDEEITETYQGGADEVLHQLRRRCACGWRKP